MKNSQIKRYKLIACGVLHKEISSLRGEIPSDVELTEVWLEQGLHREPHRLNTLVRAEIAATEARGGEYDAILLGYGLCSHGIVGVRSERYTIVVPRAHDCITLFLGSKERYLEEFSKAPGTYWYTPGFISGEFQPGMSEKYAGVYHEFEENFEHYLEKFGDEEMAKYVIDSQEQAWIKNYSRGAYVASGLPGEDRLRERAKAFCRERNWTFEEVEGDFSLIRDMISGKWDEERFLVVKPGGRIVPGSTDSVITVEGAHGQGFSFGGTFETSFLYDGTYREVPPKEAQVIHSGPDLVIGIDAGGTYTDAAVISLENRQVRAAAKSPTTHHDLALGIRNVLLKLPEDLIRNAHRIAISTTLATNAIVEEMGSRTGLLLIGYDEHVSSLVRIGSGDIKAVVPGCHDIHGLETLPLDESQLVKTAKDAVARGVESLAISSYMGTRNPGHENRAAEMLSGMIDIPIVTGHDLTDDIDSVRRAHTALLNARLLPVIERLVDSIERVIAQMGLDTDIRLVTTDGTLMNTQEARRMPVRMVLSGPAASVMGVRFLVDESSCVLTDMGGTTTDIAVIEGGSAKRTGRGAYVGGYRTSISAVDIQTLGLGGDSGIRWSGDAVTVGPQRVIPISRLSAAYPGIQHRLKSLKGFSGTDYDLVQPGTFYQIIQMPENTSYLNEREKLALSVLENGPLAEIDLAERLAYPYYSLLGLDRLEKLGIIRRSGLAPTDLVVLNGHEQIRGCDSESARLLITLYAERSGMDEDEFIRHAWNVISRKAAAAVITESMSQGIEDGSFPGCHYCRQSFGPGGPVDVTYRLKPKLIGVGAPAEMLLGGLGDYLAAEAAYPKWGEVANAIGAAAGTGGMHIDMQIIPGGDGKFILYAASGRYTFRSLDNAKEEAVKLARETALIYTQSMGYDRFALTVTVSDRSAPTLYNESLYIDTSVVSTLKY